MPPEQALLDDGLDELFPFHLAFAGDGRITLVGSALRRVCPGITPGVPVGDVLHLRRPALPFTLAALQPHQRSLIVLETRSNGLKLRGQVRSIAGGAALLFLGAPWISELRELKQYGITLDDLPPHGSQAETLFLLRANRIAADDAGALARQLEQRQAELDAATTGLRAVLETAAEGIVTMGADGRIRSFNTAAERIFGYAAGEVVGQDVTILMPPATAAAHGGYMQRYLQHGGGSVVGHTREIVGRHRDGRELALELSVSDASIGADRLFTGILRDLRERKRLERHQAAQVVVANMLLRLHSLEDLITTVAAPLAETLGFDAVVLWHRRGNAAHLSYLARWAADPERYRPFLDAVRDTAIMPGQGPVGEAYATARAVLVPDLRTGASHLPADCGLRSAVAFPIHGERTVHGVVELLRRGPLSADESLGRTLEAIGQQIGLAVERAEALRLAEESARAREQFLNTVSHELRTPLNAIIGLAHLLEGTTLDAEQVRQLKGIRFAGDTLLGIINDLLDFSRIRSGGVTFEAIPFDLSPLLDGLVNTVSGSAGERGLSLALEIAPEVPRTVLGDPGRLSQVLMNLVGNAIKFTERGGVTVRVARAARAEGAGLLEFSVIDTGVGIEPAERERIFEAFRQARADTSRRHGGSGLGLAIVRELVQAQGGTIALESAVGVGSTFTVTLPFAEAAAAGRRAPEAGPAVSLSGLRVLLAEDNELNRLVATRILERAGAVVTTANDGVEAVALVQARPFDVVLMDIQMPEMDGFEATWRIRNELGIDRDRLPIIALTATGLTEEQRHAEAAGMNDFIMKPFRPDLLCGRVAGILAGRTAQGPEGAGS